MRRRFARSRKDTDRLLNLLRLSGSNVDGEALAALRRASAQMEAMGLDWDDIVSGSPRRGSSASQDDLLRHATREARTLGFREGFEAGIDEGYRRGVAEGRAEAAGATPPPEADTTARSDPRANAVHAETDARMIDEIIAEATASRSTLEFVSSLRSYLKQNGYLTDKQRMAAIRTHARVVGTRRAA